MAPFSAIGNVILSLAIAAFIYYFFWISVLPFMLIEEGNKIVGYVNVACDVLHFTFIAI